MPARLASHLAGVRLHTTPFFFEGGDILCDRDNAYVAPQLLARNQPFDVDGRAGLVGMISRT